MRSFLAAFSVLAAGCLASTSGTSGTTTPGDADADADADVEASSEVTDAYAAVEAEAELQKVKAGYIWSKIPTEEDRNNGANGVDQEGAGKAKAGKHTGS